MTPSASVTANHDADSCQINDTNNNTEVQGPEHIQRLNPDLPNSSNEENNNKPDMSDLENMIDVEEDNLENNDSADDAEGMEEQISPEAFNEEDESSGEISKIGFLDQYFKSIQNGIEPIKPHTNKATYWIQPPVPNVSSFSKAAKHPEWFYCPKVFLWMPHALMDPSSSEPNIKEKLKCPAEGCKSSLSLKGFLEEPRARKIVDLHQ
ncbi:hypothetical protein [Parasitella parasitica]|uniref:Uncharacterized protein n=1 Tax=Parasitella parasitica TaxID=35722 RepID=A0A0B7NRE4_9FUNG|nr:hypothetical protein [Parasitella parasitica]